MFVSRGAVLVAALLAAAATAVVAQSSSSSLSPGCACGVKESDLPLCKDLCKKPKLTPQQKLELQQANKDLSNRLAPDTHATMHRFIDELQDDDNTYIKLSNAIIGGHAIHYKFVEGDEHAVVVAAEDLGLHVKGDSIEIPEGSDQQLEADLKADQAGHSRAASHRWEAARNKDSEAAGKMPEIGSKYISHQQAEALVASNRAVVLKLKPYAAEHILQFLKKVYDSHNHIRLFGAIKNGHVVDYELINGERAEIKAIGKESGLEVTDNAISTPGDTDESSEKKTADGFHAHVPEAAEESSLQSNCAIKSRCPKEGDVVIVPAPGHALRSTEPNTMLLSVVTPPGGPKITN